MKAYIHIRTCTPMFMTVLFEIAPRCKQLKCPWKDEWMSKLSVICLYNGTLLSNERTTDICCNLNESQNEYIEWKLAAKMIYIALVCHHSFFPQGNTNASLWTNILPKIVVFWRTRNLISISYSKKSVVSFNVIKPVINRLNKISIILPNFIVS